MYCTLCHIDDLEEAGNTSDAGHGGVCRNACWSLATCVFETFVQHVTYWGSTRVLREMVYVEDCTEDT